MGHGQSLATGLGTSTSPQINGPYLVAIYGNQSLPVYSLQNVANINLPQGISAVRTQASTLKVASGINLSNLTFTPFMQNGKTLYTMSYYGYILFVDSNDIGSSTNFDGLNKGVHPYLALTAH